MATIFRNQDRNGNAIAQFKSPNRKGFSIQIPYNSDIPLRYYNKDVIFKAEDIALLVKWVYVYGTDHQASWIRREFDSIYWLEPLTN